MSEVNAYPITGWHDTTFGDLLSHRSERGKDTDPLLSVTASRGVVLHGEAGRRDISNADKSAYWRVYPGDIAYNSMRMWQGVSGRSAYFGIVSPAYTVCAPRPSCVSEFIAHLLKHPSSIAAFKNRSQGLVSDTWNLKYKSFSAIPTRVPASTTEQQRIGEVLDTVDATIRSTESVISKLERVEQGMLHDLLTRGIEVGGELRDPTTHPAEFGETPLGAIARSLPVKTVGEVLARRPKNGHSPPEAGEWTGTWMLGLGCLTPSGFAPRQLKPAPRDDPALVPALLVDGDLLMSRSNTREFVGLVGQYRDVGAPCTYPDLMMRLIPNGEISKAFLELALRSHSCRRQIQSLASGTSGSMVKIGSATVMNLKIVVPEKDEQERIVSAHASFKERIAQEVKELQKLKLLRSGLMDDLLRGKVRVSLDEGAA
jgi:type I restriction enzyme S subunit